MPTTYAIPNGRTAMDATLYTGNATITNIYNSSGTLYPDLLWIKSRSNVSDHILANSNVGVQNFLNSNNTGAQQNDARVVRSVTSGSFQLGTDAGASGSNQSGQTYVAWQWNAGQGVNNTNVAGSITSTVSANTTNGFSIVTFTTPTSGVATIGHGLSTAPSMMILKGRSNATGWPVYHASTGNTGYTVLNTTAAFATDANAWNNTSPTSSVFTIGTTFNNLGTYVAYCWAPVAGFSQFGSYTGNGSADGPFIYTGFRPKFVMYKRTDTTGDWYILDTSRSTYNAMNNVLFPNASNAEDTGGFWIDGLSNGFKQRGTGANSNANGGNYIYAAFAENPFKYANAR